MSSVCQMAVQRPQLVCVQGDKLLQLMDGVIDNRNVPLLSLLVFEKVTCNNTESCLVWTANLIPRTAGTASGN